MFPVLIFAGIAALIAWSVQPKTTGVVGPPALGPNPGPSPIPVPTAMLPASKDSKAAAQQPLMPEAERLLSLLVLFARDKKYPAGQKRYLSPNTALEAVKLARALGLPKTAMAIRRDDAIPTDESIPGRTISIRESVVAYGTKGKA